MFNAHFLNVTSGFSPGSVSDDVSLNEVSCSTKSVFLAPTTPYEVEDAIFSLKSTSAAGYDLVSSRVLRHCGRLISIPLADAVNASFLEGVFPSRLKYTVVRPLHKSGDHGDKNNYRPIALTSVFSKLYEKLFLTRIESLCADFISPRQFGFMKGRTCLDAAAYFVSDLIGAMDRKEQAVGLLIDLQKAFDCVNHNLLLSRAEYNGIRGKSLEWLKSFLTGRQQKVTVNGHSSDYKIISAGVPQGSILGPILFNIYINNAISCIHDETIALYADDIALGFKGATIEDIEINSSAPLHNLVTFLSHSGLSISSKKTKIMSFSTSRGSVEEVPQLYLTDECPIAETTTYKYLGLTIDCHFSWESHISSLCKKVSSGLFVLRSFASYRSNHLLKMIYFSLIESHLKYCIVLWGSATNYSLTRLLILQKQAIRIIAGLKRRDSCRTAFRHLGLLTLTGLYLLEVIVYARFRSETPAGSQFHHYPTRPAIQLRPAQVRLNIAGALPQHAGALFFNKLPATFTSITTERDFRQALRTHLIATPYYSVGEFLTTV